MAQETRNRIRKAAVKVISREGFFNTRMQDIADQAGLAVGTIYNYFSSKDEVLAYIFKYEVERRREIMSELKKRDLSLKELLVHFLNRHFSVLRENPELGRVLVREKDFSRAKKDGEIKAHRNFLIKMLENLFERGVKEGEIKEVDTHLLAVYFLGSIQGIIEHALTQPEMNLLEKAPDFVWQRIEHIFIE
ncbi:TetR family transcriptional regulator [Halanaerobium saccharolyticum]|uniref:TetR family transcriptional regulator n=1 Tax=Halanaerobium saccharolyticum TaxID=43595 RepID=A0A4R6M397_9FIRM|nr:TetR/AcrR family transcriptional regulator [Halanaerobium saccharolyticum]TDO94359.1 TetR family transcriptional regulator [Halanaerobium saccharolyticum]